MDKYSNYLFMKQWDINTHSGPNFISAFSFPGLNVLKKYQPHFHALLKTLPCTYYTRITRAAVINTQCHLFSIPKALRAMAVFLTK